MSLNIMDPPQLPDEIGRLGGYRVLKKLGEGAMGVVYLAEDPQLQRRVALKVMRPEAAVNPTSHARFLHEARAIAAVRNDHIVAIHQVGEAHGVPFLAMEHLQGMTLETWLTKGKPLTYVQIARLGKEMAKGLTAAHGSGLVHRDLKPANVWLEKPKGRIKLLDFGMARSFQSQVHLTQNGLIVGTPAYMSPEQARGATMDGRADLFSLGVVLYQLCAGRLPFQGDNPLVVMAAITFEHPPHLNTLKAECPPPLAEFIMRLLSKRPEDRPSSAAECVEQLHNIERHLLIQESTPGNIVLVNSTVVPLPTDPPQEPPPPYGEQALAQALQREQRKNRVLLWLLPGAGAVAVLMILVFWLLIADNGSGITRRRTVNKADVAALTSHPLLQEVLLDLHALNPHFSGEVPHRIERDVVVELSLCTDNLVDIGPLKKLRGLRKLSLKGSNAESGALTDLSGLRGLQLEDLDCSHNPRLTDLGPLRGMPLRRLAASHTGVADLTPIQDAPLQFLYVAQTRIVDVSCLQQAPLETLAAQGGTLDLDTVGNLRVKTLSVDFDYWRDVVALRKLNGLVSINGQTPSVFWRGVDEKQGPFLQWRDRVRKLPAREQWAEVVAELKRENPDFVSEGKTYFQGERLVKVELPSNAVTELAPLQALPDLRELVLEPAKDTKGALHNLWPLKGLPLKSLVLHHNPITDLRPLAKMPLEDLNLSFTPVLDVSPLRHTKLVRLRLWGAAVQSIEPLKGLALEELSLTQSGVKDYSLLREFPLRRVWIDHPEEHVALLKRIPTLVEVNYKPKEQFLE
jgi:tRNA A-37 threonylcarbamoyl transferase component Bud32/Leucine-rich repeat (LRR) protein